MGQAAAPDEIALLAGGNARFVNVNASNEQVNFVKVLAQG
jgi:hypothetical protein